MPKQYPMDVRERVIETVAAGASRREAAFGDDRPTLRNVQSLLIEVLTLSAARMRCHE
jgi:hypothetical protein